MANPYQSPETPSVPEAVNHQADLNTVISGQKILIYAILGYLCMAPLLVGSNMFLEGTSEQPVATPMFALALVGSLGGLLVAAITASVGVFRMGRVLFPGTTRYVYAAGVLTPAPLIGLLVMLVANSQATRYLKERDIKVGFFGAKK